MHTYTLRKQEDGAWLAEPTADLEAVGGEPFARRTLRAAKQELERDGDITYEVLAYEPDGKSPTLVYVHQSDEDDA